MSVVTVSVVVRGRVQAVGFRWFTRDAATARGVTGWVRNRMDGTVEALLHGDQDAVDDVIDALRSGPRGAHVTDLTREDSPERDVPLSGFEIRRSE